MTALTISSYFLPYALALCFGLMLWPYALALCFGLMLWPYALALCFGLMLWPYALAFIFALSVLNVRAQPARFQNIPEVMARFDNAKQFRKKEPTLGRLPARHEIGTLFPTWVAYGLGGVIQETTNHIAEYHVIARKPAPIRPDYYNQWLVKRLDWLETYGTLPTSRTEFAPFTRQAIINAIPIDDILQLLGTEDGETAVIHVDWNPEGMRVFRNGYLTDKGYGIAPKEMEATYQRIEE